MRISHEEFASAQYQEPYIYERVRARLVVMSPAGPEHRSVSRQFRRALGRYWGLNPEFVDDVGVEDWVSTSPDDDRIPDICVYLAGSSSQLGVPVRVPDLVFEFVRGDRSDQERVYIDRCAEYHHIGVKEYVIVDCFKESVLVLTWQSDDSSKRTLLAADGYSTPLLPGLSIALAEAFA